MWNSRHNLDILISIKFRSAGFTRHVSKSAGLGGKRLDFDSVETNNLQSYLRKHVKSFEDLDIDISKQVLQKYNHKYEEYDSFGYKWLEVDCDSNKVTIIDNKLSEKKEFGREPIVGLEFTLKEPYKIPELKGEDIVKTNGRCFKPVIDIPYWRLSFIDKTSKEELKNSKLEKIKEEKRSYFELLKTFFSTKYNNSKRFNYDRDRREVKIEADYEKVQEYLPKAIQKYLDETDVDKLKMNYSETRTMGRQNELNSMRAHESAKEYGAYMVATKLKVLLDKDELYEAGIQELELDDNIKTDVKTSFFKFSHKILRENSSNVLEQIIKKKTIYENIKHMFENTDAFNKAFDTAYTSESTEEQVAESVIDIINYESNKSKRIEAIVFKLDKVLVDGLRKGKRLLPLPDEYKSTSYNDYSKDRDLSEFINHYKIAENYVEKNEQTFEEEDYEAVVEEIINNIKKYINE